MHFPSGPGASMCTKRPGLLLFFCSLLFSMRSSFCKTASIFSLTSTLVFSPLANLYVYFKFGFLSAMSQRKGTVAKRVCAGYPASLAQNGRNRSRGYPLQPFKRVSLLNDPYEISFALLQLRLFSLFVFRGLPRHPWLRFWPSSPPSPFPGQIWIKKARV